MCSFSTKGISWVVHLSNFFSARSHPKFLPNQEMLEIKLSLVSIPIMAIPSTFIFLAEMRGYSRLYDGIEGVT
jgi:hypothetical protein